MRRPERTLAAVRGEWGERVASEFLRLKGYEIVERDSRPCARDRRLDIDIVAYDAANDAVVFVEVKQHAARSPYARRMRSVDKRKMENLRRVCNAWLRVNSWKGNYRFDVVEVYGVPGRRAECDHIERIGLFPARGRFVRWD